MKQKAILLLILIFIVNIGGGIANSLLGSAWPAISIDIATPISYQSIIIITFYIGNTIGATYAQKVIARFLTFLPLIAGVLLVAITVFIFSVSKSFAQMICVSVFIGLGIGFVQATINGYVTKHFNTSAMNWLHSFFGIGCTLAPALLAYYIGVRGSWALGYQSTAGIEIVIIVLIVISYPLWKIHGAVLPKKDNRLSGDSNDKTSKVKAKSLTELLKAKGTKSVIAVMLVYSSFEAIIVFWTTSYLVVAKNLPEADAAGMMVYFFGGQVLGRIIAGFIVFKLTDTKLIRICQLVTFVFVIALFFIPTSMLPILLGLIGLCVGPIFPNLIHEVPAVVEEENVQGVIGLQIASAYVSSIVMPFIFSIFTDIFSFAIYPIFLLILLTASFTLKYNQDKKRIGEKC